MIFVANFRWFTDDRTEAIRTAKATLRKADDELNAYTDHQHEQHPRGSCETPEYGRLNGIANNARDQLRHIRGW